MSVKPRTMRAGKGTIILPRTVRPDSGAVAQADPKAPFHSGRGGGVHSERSRLPRRTPPEMDYHLISETTST
jgi:hypothetical protein